ncbi:uncharacterized protein LOC124817231 [Hydra vulgaris]|uniref:uncharacterized protein LOC124817231 n=1 Tax=Hydra vulgaris TaxID=6087 RepID=UPI001F5E54C2|nr:uncharacterized protein LOC124817231 [Hydra vulgaris]
MFCWTDSTIFLHWLKISNQKYQAFVENCLVKIRTLFPIEFWKYVESTRNPEDMISRGSSFKFIFKNSLWFNGPNYLNDILIPWPIYNLLEPNDGEDNICLLTTVKPLKINLKFINTDIFSSYEQLNKTCVVIKPTISADEIEREKTLWVQNEQRDVMTNKNFKQLKSDLGLRVVDGIIQCHGKMDSALIPRDAKFPIFIPHSSHLSKLLIVYFYKLVKHNDLKETLSELRTKFWIPQCRQLICNYPPSPPLPLCRLCDEYPFKYTAVDYAGPVFNKNIYGDSDIMYKGWIFLFTCASTRSICLDLVSDILSAVYILGLRCFFARRGVPSKIISDNGTPFVAKQKQLFASNKSIEWQFNVPSALWWGGFFEKMVKMVKRCLKEVVGKASNKC